MKMRLFVLVVVVLGFTMTAFTQVEVLEGNWVIKTLETTSPIGMISIDNAGNAQFSESLSYSHENTEYHFHVAHRGKIEYGEDRQFVMGSAGVATSTESKLYNVLSSVVATGVGSEDNNIIAGIWAEVQTYTKNISTLEIISASPVPFVLMREGYTPEGSWEFMEGTWKLQVNDDSLVINWEGEIELSGEGTILGMMGDKGQASDSPLAGLFTVEGSEFMFSYTTTVVVANVGELIITVSGIGEINEERTAITGTFSVSIERSETVAGGGGGTSPQSIKDLLEGKYTGTFKLDRSLSSHSTGWELLN